MVWYHQMRQLMHQNVLDAGQGRVQQPQVQRDGGGDRLTAAPAALHAAKAQRGPGDAPAGKGGQPLLQKLPREGGKRLFFPRPNMNRKFLMWQR